MNQKRKFGTYTTDEKGEVNIKNLDIGKYTLKETKGLQGYYVTSDKEIIVNHNQTTTIEVGNEKEKGQLQIIKIDADHNEIAIPNVEFEILNENKEVIETIKTNEEGIATTSRLPSYNKIYFVHEKATDENYILDETHREVKLVKDKVTSLVVENKHKEGNLKVYKVDADDNKITIGGITFELWSKEFNKLVGIYTTDLNGEISVKNLRTGDYILKETTKKNGYYLAKDTNITIKWNETTSVTIENELEKGQIKVIKVDKDDNTIHIPDTKFEILDENKKYIETICTNENGEAISSKLPSYNRKYYIREIEANKCYELLDQEFAIGLTVDKTEEITIENKVKSGKIQITKVDKDNNDIKLSGVKFDILNERTGKVVDTIITNDKGIAITKDLNMFDTYTAIEITTDELYVLNMANVTNIQVTENGVTDIVVENEKKKGQIEVYKLDSENKEIKLEGVEFQVINSKDELVETIRTNKDGYAITSKIPIGEYKLKEVKTDDMHILNTEVVKVDVTTDIISKLEITNERIKGQIKIVKTSEDDNFINGEKAGTPIPNVKFEIYDSDRNKVDEVITDEKGIAITKKLDKGEYIIKEVESGRWYLLNEEEFATKISSNEEIVEVDITNESDKPSVDVEKTGLIQTTSNQEIRYDFHIKNTGNTNLNNFTWFDYLPSEHVKMSKLVTGTYNQDLNYNIYYKTNLNDYKLLAENLNTQVNNYVNFSKIQLEEGETIKEFRMDFETVDVGFESVINPYIFVITNDGLDDNTTFTNKTRIEGNHDGYLVWDEDDHTTQIYKKEIKVKKLPRTGC